MEHLDHWLWEIGEAGRLLTRMNALEGAAGNISVMLPPSVPGIDALLGERFGESEPFELPPGVMLPDGVLLVTGAGRRLRDAAARPNIVLCAIAVGPGGNAALHRSPGSGVRPTSEIDTHAGIHAALAPRQQSLGMHTVIHAQPPYLTWLSHIPAYRDGARMNRQLLRWQPETLVMLPEGIAVLPFATPGTPEQGRGTVDAMLRHRVVVWAKHGIVSRSGAGPLAACDLIEYVETAAHYEVLDIQCGRPADGLSLEELRAIALRFGVSSDLVDRLPAHRLV